MWHEAVRNTLAAVAFTILFLGSGATGGSCQSTSSPVDDRQAKSMESPSSTSNSPSSGVQATDQQDQSSKLNSKDKDKADKGKTHVRLGTVTVGASYTRFSNGFLVPFWGYGFYPYYFGYEPFFFDPFYRSYFYEPYATGFAYGPDKGEVRLEAKPSSASVYLNDAYAGAAGKLKHMWLAPGAYDLTVAAPDGSEFHQRIYVLSGKSLKIHAKIVPQNE